MSEPTVAYLNSSSFKLLCADVARLERQVHHEIDTYGMEMSPELKEALQALERACREVKECMEAEYTAFSSQEPQG